MKIRVGGTRAAVAAMLVAAGIGLGPVAPAGAQTGYPPGPCTATATSDLFGTIAVGAIVTIQLVPVCSWTPGTIVAITVNGIFVGNKTVAVNGAVSVGVNVVSVTLLAIDDPVMVPSACGPNTATATGPSATAGTLVTQTVTFNVDCGTPVVAVRTTGLLARTGATIARGVATAFALVGLGAILVIVARRRRYRDRQHELVS